MFGSKRTVIPIRLLGGSQTEVISLILKLCGNKFDDSEITTIGKESYNYEAFLHEHYLIFKLWPPTASEHWIKSVSIAKNVEGIILVYSITNRKSFENLDNWIQKIYNFVDTSNFSITIFANNSELEEFREVSYEEGENYANSYGFHFFEVSAETGQNIKEAFYDIFESLYKKLEDEITGKKIMKIPTIPKENKKKKKKEIFNQNKKVEEVDKYYDGLYNFKNLNKYINF